MELVLYLHGFCLVIGDDRTLCHTVNDFPFDITLVARIDSRYGLSASYALAVIGLSLRVSGAGHDKFIRHASAHPRPGRHCLYHFKVGVFAQVANTITARTSVSTCPEHRH